MAANTAENYESIGALLLQVVDDSVANVIPDHAVLEKLLPPFKAKPTNPGEKHIQPTIVRYPDGFSFVPAGIGPVELNGAKSGKIERAEMLSNSMYLTEVVDKDIIDRTKNKNGSGYSRAAVKEAMAVIIPMMVAAAKREGEITRLYGRGGRARVSKVSGAFTTVIAASVTGANGDTVTGATVILVDKSEWGPGIWTGAEGMTLSFFDEANTTDSSGVNPTAGVFLGTSDIAAIDMDNRCLILKDNLVAALQAATGPITIWRDATREPVSGVPQLSESLGILGIMKNQGKLFNIDGSKYTLFRSPKFNANNAAFTLKMALQASTRASYNGTESGAVFVLPTAAWSDLATDETTFRRYPKVDGDIKVGPEALLFAGATGLMAMKPHPMMKRGYAPLLNINASKSTKDGLPTGGDMKMVGDSEWTFDTTGGDTLHYIPNYSGYQIRMKANKAPYINPPGRSLLVSNILDSQA